MQISKDQVEWPKLSHLENSGEKDRENNSETPVNINKGRLGEEGKTRLTNSWKLWLEGKNKERNWKDDNINNNNN